MKTWAEELNRYFSEGGIQIANIYMKKCSTQLIIRKMQVTTLLRYDLTPIWTAVIKKTRDDKWTTEDFLYYGWEYELVQPLWRIVQMFLKKPKTELKLIRSSNSTSVCKSKGNKIMTLKGYLHPYIHRSIYSSQDIETTYMSIDR